MDVHLPNAIMKSVPHFEWPESSARRLAWRPLNQIQSGLREGGVSSSCCHDCCSGFPQTIFQACLVDAKHTLCGRRFCGNAPKTQAPHTTTGFGQTSSAREGGSRGQDQVWPEQVRDNQHSPCFCEMVELSPCNHWKGPASHQQTIGLWMHSRITAETA